MAKKGRSSTPGLASLFGLVVSGKAQGAEPAGVRALSENHGTSMNLVNLVWNKDGVEG